MLCFWCQFCTLRLSKKTGQTIMDCQSKCYNASGNRHTPTSKKRQFFFYIVLYVLYCCSLEGWQCVGFWLKQQHILNKQQKNFRLNLKKQVFLGNTSGSGEEKGICCPVPVQMMICLPSRKLASLEILVGNTLTMQAMVGGVWVCLFVNCDRYSLQIGQSNRW